MKKLFAIIVLGFLLSACSDYKACRNDALKAGYALDEAVQLCGKK